MIGDLWVLVTLLETPAREGAPVEEPRMLALTEAVNRLTRLCAGEPGTV